MKFIVHKVCLVLFFTGLFTTGWSQKLKLSGRINDQEGKPVAFATLQVLRTTIGTQANENGQYELGLTTGSYQIKVSAAGYAATIAKLELKGDQSQDFVLTPSTNQLDEVVVTADRDEDKLVKAQTSITVLTEKNIRETRTWSLSDLMGLVPNYTYSELGVAFQQIQSIRGIQVFSENPAIATYIDGVNQLDIIANGFKLTDIERIEILRGPQGTLFGRNAMGGVINITTKRPSNQPSGYVDVSAGNLGLQRYAAGYKGALIKDRLFVALSGLHEKRDGFMKNDTTGTVNPDPNAHGQLVGSEQSFYGNIGLTFLATERLTLSFNLKGQSDFSDNSGFMLSVANEELARKDPNKIYLSRIQKHQRNVFNAALKADYRLDAATISSTTTYQEIAFKFSDLDFGFGFIYDSYNDGKKGVFSAPQRVWTQEFRIRSNESSSKLSYQAGLYGFWQNSFEPTTNTLLNGMFVSKNVGDNSGLAAYGQLKYDITDALNLTAGLRYDLEYRNAIFGSAMVMNGQERNLKDTTVKGNYSALSPKVTLGYSLNNASQVYLTYTKGFRAGGINAQLLPKDIDYSFKPEYSDNYELGVKSALLEGKLFVSAAAYMIDWKDIQFFNMVAPGVFARSNAGNGRSQGIELEATWLPIKHLQIEVNGSLNNSSYQNFNLTRFDMAAGRSVTKDFSGNRLSNAPASTYFIAAQYNIPISGDFKLSVRGEYRGIGDQYFDVQNSLKQTAYSLINARVAVGTERVEGSVWVRNLADTRAISYGTPDTSFGRSTLMNAPRTFGVSLTSRF